MGLRLDGHLGMRPSVQYEFSRLAFSGSEIVIKGNAPDTISRNLNHIHMFSQKLATQRLCQHMLFGRASLLALLLPSCSVQDSLYT